ncbi:MAG: lactate racemase domain-containing protein, partial [Verrucomicrobiota bacterium]
MNTLSKSAFPGKLSQAEVVEIVSQALPATNYSGRKVLLVVPDHTRTAPVGLLFKTIFDQIGQTAQALDVIVALGTHPAMSEAAICERLEISVEEHRGRYSKVRFFNHEW